MLWGYYLSDMNNKLFPVSCVWLCSDNKAIQRLALSYMNCSWPSRGQTDRLGLINGNRPRWSTGAWSSCLKCAPQDETRSIPKCWTASGVRNTDSRTFRAAFPVTNKKARLVQEQNNVGIPCNQWQLFPKTHNASHAAGRGAWSYRIACCSQESQWFHPSVLSAGLSNLRYYAAHRSPAKTVRGGGWWCGIHKIRESCSTVCFHS